MTSLSLRDADPVGGRASRTLLTALAPAAWGTTYLVTTELLPPGYPLLSTVIRVLPAGLILLAIVRTLPRGSWWWRALLLGVLNIGVFNALLFVAVYRLPGGVAAILTSTQPLLVALLALPALGERPTTHRLLWSIAGIAGVALIVLRGDVSFDPVGVVAGVLAACAMSAGVVLTRRWGRPADIGGATMAAWQLTAGGVVLLPLAVAVEGVPSALGPPAIAGYAWLCLAGALLAYPLWFTGIARLPVTAVSFLTLLSPVIATVLGWAVLGEALTVWQGVGFCLTLTAIAAAQLPPGVLRSRRRR